MHAISDAIPLVMIIAVYANFKICSSSDPYLNFAKDLVVGLAHAYPVDDFYLFQKGTDIAFGEKVNNLYTVAVNAKQGFFSNFFLAKKLNREVRRIKADAILSFDTALKTNIAQSTVVGDASTLQKSSVPLQKLNNLFCLSQSEKSALIDIHKIDQGKIHVVYGGAAKPIKPIADEEKTATKRKYTEGREYFLYRGLVTPGHNIISLLKAFSLFKKRQKSEMKLVIAGELAWESREFSKLMNTYKYKDDVVFIDNKQEQESIQLLLAAFAFIQPYISNSLSFAWEAMKGEVPVLITGIVPLAEVAPGAASYFDGGRWEDLADKLMLVYKDEALRENLIEKGKEALNKIHWDETVKLVGQCLKPTGY